MNGPFPQRAPLGDLIVQLGDAINGFVATDVELDEAAPTSSLVGVKRNLLQHFKKILRADRELGERLQLVRSIGSAILELTRDPNISGPVTKLIQATSSIQADVEQCSSDLKERMTLWRLFIASSGMAHALSDSDPRIEAIVAERDNLIAYYLLERGED